MARTRRYINAVHQTLARNPEVSSQRNPLPNLCQSTFNRITRKDLQKHPYKIQTSHALEPGDPARRLGFCNRLLQMPQRTLAETCIMDESNSYMNGTASRQNTRRYADRSNLPHNFVYNKPNDRRKWVVFAALVGNKTIIGPVFLERSIDSQVYLDLISDHIVPGLCRSFQQQQNGGFSQSVVYAGGCSCSPCLTCSQSPARVVWQSCGWNGTSDWLASQKSRSNLHWTSIYGVQSSREFTDKAILPIFDSCGIASLMP